MRLVDRWESHSALLAEEHRTEVRTVDLRVARCTRLVLG